MYKNDSYIELNIACKTYKTRFCRLLSALTISYIKNYALKHNKVMPICVAHFLAYVTINKLIQKGWFNENLDFIDSNFLSKNLNKNRKAA